MIITIIFVTITIIIFLLTITRIKQCERLVGAFPDLYSKNEIKIH